MRRLGIGSLVAIVLASAVVAPSVDSDRFVEMPAALAAEEPQAILEKFETFASGWMEKLRERERFNISKVKWRPVAGGVEAVYVGYETANYRILPLSNVETHPVGKLVYLELKLRLVGETEEVARARQPIIVERVEVTELFRYHRGKWVF